MTLRIYTRTGDTGNTGLFGGKRVAKDDLRVEAYGAVDELNASLGVVLAFGSNAKGFDAIATVLTRVQHDLFQLGADLATPFDDLAGPGVKSRIKRVGPERVIYLEERIDLFESELEPLKQFVLPGGMAPAALLHVSRTICRRAERRCVTLANSASETSDTADVINPEVIRYLNRLSDLLFVLARATNSRADVPDVKWNPEV